jgi:hypothetical protein
MVAATRTNARGRYRPLFASLPPVGLNGGQTTFVMEQGNFAIVTTLPFESVTVPAEGSTTDADGTSRAHVDPEGWEAAAEDTRAPADKTVAITTATNVRTVFEVRSPIGPGFPSHLVLPRCRKEW